MELTVHQENFLVLLGIFTYFGVISWWYEEKERKSKNNRKRQCSFIEVIMSVGK